ncbi:insulin-like 3 [Cricetulus griseus]|uniref:Insulin-like 3 n=1 Tax=Cricetulus griseus TaxID=10029 RepID=A0A9J7H9F9_CRIGR|nr:insulin-like 3 [Cricetulus griseus]XP_035307206.1 insulin-like 3 [Cricetulus griseus]
MAPPVSFTAQTAFDSQQSSCLSFLSARKTCGNHHYNRRGTWFSLKCWEVLAPGRETSGSLAGHTAPGRDPKHRPSRCCTRCSRQGPWAVRGNYKGHPRQLPLATMRALLLLLLLLLLPTLELALRSRQSPEARDKLCGHHLVRALVRVCGGPRWSSEASQPADARDSE